MGKETDRLDYDAKHWRHNILAWLEHVAELQRSQYLLDLESGLITIASHSKAASIASLVFPYL